MVVAGVWTRVEAVRGGPEWCWRHESRQLVGARSRKVEREGKRAHDGWRLQLEEGGWVAVGGRMTTHRRGVRLLQRRRSYVLLQSSSSRRRTTRQARHSKLR